MLLAMYRSSCAYVLGSTENRWTTSGYRFPSTIEAANQTPATRPRGHSQRVNAAPMSSAPAIPDRNVRTSYAMNRAFASVNETPVATPAWL